MQYCLTEEAKLELLKLSMQDRRLVLEGLYGKLQHCHRTGEISFSYKRCPVCDMMGASEENHEEICPQCPIVVACQHPFVEGFRDDHEASAQYFKHMLAFMLENVPKDRINGGALVVGGSWGPKGFRKPSGVARKISDALQADLLNGGPVDMLQHIETWKYGLVVWMPNVPNTEEKVYPKKKTGAVLIVSKVMREQTTHLDSAKRIFAMRGNAVIEITEGPMPGKVGFRLRDALSNDVYSGHDISELVRRIEEFTRWSNGQIRVRSIQLPPEPEMDHGLELLLGVVRKLSDKVERGLGERYFGNVSTRCVKLFPSAMSMDNSWVSAWVSGRNIDKRYIQLGDMVWVAQHSHESGLFYQGERKPSVDAAIQLSLYRMYPHLRYMIHGHASIKGAPETDVYFPCGDLREVGFVSRLLREGQRAINLRNHGFLIVASCMEELVRVVEDSEIINRL